MFKPSALTKEYLSENVYLI
nr:hypothetical protein [Flavobacterium sp. N502536]